MDRQWADKIRYQLQWPPTKIPGTTGTVLSYPGDNRHSSKLPTVVYWYKIADIDDVVSILTIDVTLLPLLPADALIDTYPLNTDSTQLRKLDFPAPIGPKKRIFTC